jgi:hypothetical protein
VLFKHKGIYFWNINSKSIAHWRIKGEERDQTRMKTSN